ncbi:MAG: alpha/beta hydrolase [bacterium]
MQGPAFWRAGTPGRILEGRWFDDLADSADQETEFEVNLASAPPDREPAGWKGYHLETDDPAETLERHWDPLYPRGLGTSDQSPQLIDPATDGMLYCLALLEKNNFVFCDARKAGDYFLRALHTLPFRGWLQTSEESPPYYQPDRHAFGRTGQDPVLVMTHGYTGNPDNWLLLAEEFDSHSSGYAVPLLPGHGLPPEDFARFDHRDWRRGINRELHWLKDHSRQLIGIGLSMGGALNLANWEMFDAIVTINTPFYMPDWRRFFLPVLHWLKQYHRFEETEKTIPVNSLSSLSEALSEAREELEKIDVPVLVINHREDQTVTVNHGVRYKNALPEADHEILEEGIHESPTQPEVARTLKQLIVEWLNKKGLEVS